MSRLNEITSLLSEFCGLALTHASVVKVVDRLQQYIDLGATFYSMDTKREVAVAISDGLSPQALRSVLLSGRTLGFRLPGNTKITPISIVCHQIGD